MSSRWPRSARDNSRARRFSGATSRGRWNDEMIAIGLRREHIHSRRRIPGFGASFRRRPFREQPRGLHLQRFTNDAVPFDSALLGMRTRVPAAWTAFERPSNSRRRKASDTGRNSYPIRPRLCGANHLPDSDVAPQDALPNIEYAFGRKARRGRMRFHGQPLPDFVTRLRRKTARHNIVAPGRRNGLAASLLYLNVVTAC